MHMSDALVSTAVGATMWAGTGATLGFSIKNIKINLDEMKIPMMGIMGAFIFASQMVNFTIPGTGSSGHIGGAVLLAGILGPAPAFLTMSVVLLIQALFFADGGILAYGCNVFNMGFFACFIAYPFILKPILKAGITKRRITIGSIIATVVSLQLGAFSVVLETYFSGISELPFGAFLIAMQPIHLAIGIVEGIITAGVFNYIYNIRPDMIEQSFQLNKEHSTISEDSRKKEKSYKKVLVAFAVFSVIIGVVISQFASSKPDGLEWSIAKTTGDTEIQASNSENKVNQKAKEIQENTAILPDYSLPNHEGERIGTSISGVIGGGMVCLLCGAAGVIITRKRKQRERNG